MKDITRTEKKYLTDERGLEYFFSRTGTLVEKDAYYHQKIHNVYFDNDANEIVRTSLEKPDFKEKLRLRAYEANGVLCPYSFLELKKKYKGVVYKRRLQLTLAQGNGILQNAYGDILTDCQIGREIGAYMLKTNCYPKQYIGYERFSFRGTEDENLRVTVDTALVSRTKGLGLCASVHDEPFGWQARFVIEIKATGGMPLALVRLLTGMKMYPVSFSKYGKVYLKNMENEKRGGNVLCLTA